MSHGRSYIRYSEGKETPKKLEKQNTKPQPCCPKKIVQHPTTLASPIPHPKNPPYAPFPPKAPPVSRNTSLSALSMVHDTSTCSTVWFNFNLMLFCNFNIFVLILLLQFSNGEKTVICKLIQHRTMVIFTHLYCKIHKGDM